MHGSEVMTIVRSLIEWVALGVVIRTFLSWSLTVEIEGRWPWQTQLSKAKPPADSNNG